MKKQVTVSDGDSNERLMYLQEKGSTVSKVSTSEKSSWKTEEVVFNSSIKEFKNDNQIAINSLTDTDDYDESDDDYIEGNTSDCSDDWRSNCGGSDVPDYIEEGTAYFDEEGNYSGGTMSDEGEN